MAVAVPLSNHLCEAVLMEDQDVYFQEINTKYLGLSSTILYIWFPIPSYLLLCL